VLQAVELPAGITDLDTALSEVQRLRAKRGGLRSGIEGKDAGISRGKQAVRQATGLTMASRIFGFVDRERGERLGG
jgi:hypothetical protein